MLFDDLRDNSHISMVLSRALKDYSVSDLFIMLSGREPILTPIICRKLQIIGGMEVFDKASKLSQEKRHEDREIAAFLLGQLGTPKRPFAEQSVSILKKLLRDDYFEVRAMAASAIGHLWLGEDSPQSVCELMEEMVTLAFDSEPHVRDNIAFSLAFYKSEQSVKVLHKLAEDISPDVRDSAQWALEMHTEAEQEKNS